MKNKSQKPFHSNSPCGRSFNLRTWLPLVTAVLSLCRLQAADITWTEAAAPSLPTQWLTTSNWDANVVPTNTDNAIFGAAGTNATVTIQMATAKSLQTVGSITVSGADTISRTIDNNSTASNGVLVLYGVNGTLIENAATAASLSFDVSSPTKSMGVGLANSGRITVDNANVLITFFSVISDFGSPQGFTKTGAGTIYLRNTNTYSGPTTNAAGFIQVDATGTIGSGAGTIYLTGGGFICAADRSGGAPIPNAVVMSADTIVENNAGLTLTSRTLPFSGNWSGSGNTLTIGNNTAVTAQTFNMRMLGGFNFGENIFIVSATPGSFAVLQLYNPATNGIQTFTGNISSPDTSGSVVRTGSTASAAGTSIFTGNNTYQGGTIITYGTLLANNTAGSALGSGQVTVTNQGVLGGNGFVVATTHIGVENTGGTVSPGSASNSIGNLSISDLTFGVGCSYIWNIQAAAPNPGVDQDLITCSSQWTDAGSGSSPITIKVNSLGAVPTGWNSSSSYDWIIIQSSAANGFNSAHFTIDTSGFSGAIAGGFGLYVDSNGALHLTYTSGLNLVINVPSGSQTQTAAGYPVLTGATNVVKIGNGELVLDNPLNTYSGLTTVLAGTVSLATDALSGSGSLGANSSTTTLGNTTGNSNATLNINVAGVNDAHGVVVASGSTGTKTIGTTLSSGTGNYQGNISLDDSVVLSAAPGGTANFSGNISGSGNVILTGGGTITLRGAGSYTGTTTASAVTLDLDGPALGTNTFNINSGVLLDNTGSTGVTLSSCPQNWNADFTFLGTTNLSLGSGPVTLSTNRIVTVNASRLTVGGVISGNASLTLTGGGTLSFTAASPNLYTGGTTNLGGVLEINATATFGTGPLVLSGGNIENDSTRQLAPIMNPVTVTTNARIYGNGTLTGTTEYRYFPFTGPITVAPGAAIYVDNIGVANNYFDFRLLATNGSTNFSNINFPIVVGDPTFDTAGAIELLDLANDSTTTNQFINSIISGPGIVERGMIPSGNFNSGGTTIFMQQNTFVGGLLFDSGGVGFGCSSISSGGVIQSGPIGTGQFTVGDLVGGVNSEVALKLFAYGGPQSIDNYIFLNGCTNIMVTGSNNLTFTSPVNMGGVSKNWDIEGTGIMTLSGQITNSVSGTGGLSKNGPGTLAFGGNNLYQGQTTVRAGTLLIINTNGSGTGTNNVNVSGGTLAGTGTVAGAVLATNGSVAPGNSVGILTLQNGLDLSSGGSLVWNLGANTTSGAGTSFSQLALTGGAMNIGGTASLTVQFTGSATAPNSSVAFWQSAHTWRIVTLSGGASITGAVFPTIVNGSSSAGTFSTSTDASGILLTFTPGAATPNSPKITQFSLVGNQILLSGTNGSPSANYRVLTTTNLTDAVSNWVAVASNTFSGTGSFTNSFTVNGSEPQRFFLISTP